MASNPQPSANASPPKPWERNGGSSGPAPFKPSSAGSTSDVVEASGTAGPGEIVSISDTNAAANRNALGRPVPSRPWEQGYGSSNYGMGGYNSGLNYNSGFGSGMYGSYGGLGGMYSGGMYGNSRHRGGYGSGLFGSGMYGGGMYNSAFGGPMGGYGMGMGGPYGYDAGCGELFWSDINSYRSEYTGCSHVHDCSSTKRNPNLQNMEPAKRKLAEEDEKQNPLLKMSTNCSKVRISDLPNAVVHHIISFGTVKDAVKTCTLSRNWKSLWTSIPNLLVHCE